MAKKVEEKKKVKRRLQQNDRVRILRAEPVGMNGKEGTFEGYSLDGYAVRVETSSTNDKGYPIPNTRVVWCEDVEKIKTETNGA